EQLAHAEVDGSTPVFDEPVGVEDQGRSRTEELSLVAVVGVGFGAQEWAIARVQVTELARAAAQERRVPGRGPEQGMVLRDPGSNNNGGCLGGLEPAEHPVEAGEDAARRW